MLKVVKMVISLFDSQNKNNYYDMHLLDAQECLSRNNLKKKIVKIPKHNVNYWKTIDYKRFVIQNFYYCRN